MTHNAYAEMPVYTPAELAGKSVTPIDRSYIDAGFTPEARLYIPLDEWNAMQAAGTIVLPGGAWEVNVPSEGRTVRVPTEDNPMSDAEVQRWTAMGLQIDQRLRLPINPRASQVLTTPGFGMFTGLGKYWKPGPNAIGDVGYRLEGAGGPLYAMVCTDRGHGDVWGLPGGHQDDAKDATILDTALREAEEEVGISARLIGGLIDHGLLRPFVRRVWPQSNRAATANAWQEGEFHFFSALDAEAEVNAALGAIILRTSDPGEVKDLGWVPLHAIRAGKIAVMSSHAEAIYAHEDYLAGLQQE